MEENKAERNDPKNNYFEERISDLESKVAALEEILAGKKKKQEAGQ